MTEDDIVRSVMEISHSGRHFRSTGRDPDATPRWPAEEFMARRGHEFGDGVRRRIESRWPKDGLREGSRVPGFPVSKGTISYRRARRARERGVFPASIFVRQRGTGQPVPF